MRFINEMAAMMALGMSDIQDNSFDTARGKKTRNNWEERKVSKEKKTEKARAKKKFAKKWKKK